MGRLDSFLTPHTPIYRSTGALQSGFETARRDRMQRARDAVNAANLQEQNRRLAVESEERIRANLEDEAYRAEQFEYKKAQDWQKQVDAAREAAIAGRPDVAESILSGMPAPHPRKSLAGPLSSGPMGPPPAPDLAPDHPMAQAEASPISIPSVNEAMGAEVGQGTLPSRGAAPPPAPLGPGPSSLTATPSAFATETAGMAASGLRTSSTLDRFGLGGIDSAGYAEAAMKSAMDDMGRLAMAYAGGPVLSPEAKAHVEQIGPELMNTYGGDREKAAKALAVEVKRLTDVEAKRKKRGLGSGRTGGPKLGSTMTGSEENGWRRFARSRIGDEIKIADMHQERASYEGLTESLDLFKLRGGDPVISQRNAIKKMIKSIEGGRITDQDYQLIARGQGLWSKMREIYAQNFASLGRAGALGKVNNYIDEIAPSDLKRLEFAAFRGAKASLDRIRESYEQNSRVRDQFVADGVRYLAAGNREQADRVAVMADEFDSELMQLYPDGIAVSEAEAEALKSLDL